MYEVLKREGIPHPRYAVLDRGACDPDLSRLVEGEDSIEVRSAPLRSSHLRFEHNARTTSD